MDNTAAKLIRITKKAQEEPKYRFTFLKHLLNEAYLQECYHDLKKGKAAGVDRRTMESYTEQEMREAIKETIIKMKTNRYRPQPVRRVHIPKENGKERLLGIPTVTDKVVQRAVTRILESIFEPTFLPVSYGYRPKRDAHECLKEVNHMVMQQKVNHMIEADIEGFFDHVNHDWMIRCIQERIGDPRFIGLIRQFLKAGVMDGDHRIDTMEGTPQGGILSPVLANIYLHYVLDLWFMCKERKQMKGYTQLIRYADDFVIGCQYQSEAEQIREDLKVRLGKFGLQLAEEKTRVVEFGRYAGENREKRGEGKPDTIEFLGFTNYCGQTRDGRFASKVKTSRKRMKRGLHIMQEWLKTMRNTLPIREMWPLLKMKLSGHYHYYGVSGNFDAIKQFYEQTRRLTFKWLNRRSQKKSWNWEQFTKMELRFPLPRPKLYYAFYNTW